jgi:hypothetical protein
MKKWLGLILAVPGETAQNDAEGTWQAVAEWLEGAGQE